MKWTNSAEMQSLSKLYFAEFFSKIIYIIFSYTI